MPDSPDQTAATTSPPQKRPIFPEDLLAFRILSSPRVSPDGRRILFVEKQVGKKNDYVRNLWIVDADGKSEPRQFTSGGKDSQPQWSPDGNRIAFVGEREKAKPQIYLIPADGGEARALTSFPEGSIGSFCWSPDGRWIAVSFRLQAPQWTEDAKKKREETGNSTPPRVIDDWWYRLDGDGYFDAQRHELHLVDVENGKQRLLYAEDTLGDFSFDFSPDSTELVVSTNRDPQALIEPWKDELVRIDVVSGNVRSIPNLPRGPKGAVRWSPRGDLIAFAGRVGEDGAYSVENLELWVCDPEQGAPRSLTAHEDYCLLAASIADTADVAFEPSFEFSPDGTMLFVRLGVHGESHIASVPTSGGPISFHTSGAREYHFGNLSADGRRMSLSVSSPTRLAEIAAAAVAPGPFEVCPLTHRNKQLLDQLDLSEPKSEWITASDGHRVQVWTLLPPNLKFEARYNPAVLEIHGGPHAQYGSGFFHEFHVLAAQGYIVFYSNPRGSKGYGRDHCAAIRGNWGSADWVDIQAVTRFIQAHPAVDPGQIGIMGGSYGGYMTNWAIGHSRDYEAAITDRCVSNIVSMSGTSDFPLQPDRYFPGNAWDRPEERWRQSPMAWIGNADTPTLIIHSEGDLRCNVEQSEQVFTALKLLGVPCRFVRYPASTSHGMSRQGPPDLRIHRLHQILEWWGQWLVGRRDN